MSVTSRKVFHDENTTVTTVSGSASFNTQFLRGLLRQIVIVPTTASTSYNISITGPSSISKWIRTSLTGTQNEEMALPMQGIYTVAITSATADEAFTIQLGLEQ